MTIVEIWKVKAGTSRATAIASMRECAIAYGDKYQRDADACNYVDRVYKCNDKCASGANAGPVGFRTRLREISPEQYLEFSRCFHFKKVAPKPEVRLKLFQALTTMGETKIEMNLLDTDATKAAVTVRRILEEEGWADVDKILLHIKEIEGPFEAGNVLSRYGG